MQEDASRSATYTVPCEDYVNVVEFSPYDCGSAASLLAYGGNQYVVVGTCRFKEEDMEVEGVEFNTLRVFMHGVRVDALAWSPESRLDKLPQVIRFCTAAADRKLKLFTSDLQERHEVKGLDGLQPLNDQAPPQMDFKFFNLGLSTRQSEMLEYVNSGVIETDKANVLIYYDSAQAGIPFTGIQIIPDVPVLVPELVLIPRIYRACWERAPTALRAKRLRTRVWAVLSPEAEAGQSLKTTWRRIVCLQQVMEGHTSYINHVVFEPTEGKQIASVSDDHTCRVWDLEGNETVSFRLWSPGVSVCWHPEEVFKVSYIQNK
ncbi:hypothetical protein NFI96_023389, partial [Prochilodus magdalenae]